MNSLSLIIVLALQLPTEPGDALQTYVWPAQKPIHNYPSKTLTQIEAHLPAKFGTQYRDKDEITWGHETTHGINSELRKHGPGGAFYLVPDKAVFINPPKCTLRDVASVVPKSLRNSRYNTYLVQQQKDWNNEPLYIFDEWDAYINGALVGFEVKPKGNSDIMIAPMEFSYYALALAFVADKRGFQDQQFKEFVAWGVRSSTIIYDKGTVLEGYKWRSTMRETFATSPDCQPLRDLAVRWYGQAFYDKYLGRK